MEYFRWNWTWNKRMEDGMEKNKMAAKKKTSDLWGSFTEVRLSKPATHMKFLSTRSVLSASR